MAISNGNIPTNAGHILKSYAEHCRLDTNNFNPGKAVSGCDIPKRIRGLKRKVLDGKYSIPSTQPVKVIKQEVKQKIQDGDIVIGNPVDLVSVTNKSGSNSDSVYGLHVPLQYILVEELNRLEQADLLLLSNHPESSGSLSEEYAKMYLKMWHDHASIAGASHLALMIQILHDNKVHAADPASQTLIEQPRLWLLARSGSSIQEQALYSKFRLDDLKSLDKPIISKSGLRCKFVPRFVSVDYPAQAFETGQQVGGNYSCPCGIPTPDHKNLAKAFSQLGMSLSERELKLKDGVLWRTQSAGILKNANKSELLRETQACDLYAGTCYQRPTKAGLMQQLVHDLHGVHRLPALLLGAPSQDILSICP